MVSGKDKRRWWFKWHWFVICLVIAGLALAAAGQIVVLRSGDIAPASVILWIAGGAVFAAALLMTIFAVLFLMYENIRSIKANTERLESAIEMLNKNRAVMAEIAGVQRLSEAAKAILLRESDRQALREAVLEKLYQQDFEATGAMIEEIAGRAEFGSLADELRVSADKYHNAGEQERINQIIAHIEKLFEDYQWLKASAEIDSLAKFYGDSERAKALRQELFDKKEQRKKELLQAWDEAVKRCQTDRSLEILRELDLYLTPNEGLALQESARDVFRTKLHNLGVEFSFAVADRRWDNVLQSGEQIIRDFPNSRMAQEIREKLDILRQRAGTGKSS